MNVDIGFIIFIVAVISAIAIGVGIIINNRRYYYNDNIYNEEDKDMFMEDFIHEDHKYILSDSHYACLEGNIFHTDN